MAPTHFSRSRSPVISIRTQPEEQSTLRAEIEAANRTQHEILPRYSWHSAFMKWDGQLLRSDDVDSNYKVDPDTLKSTQAVKKPLAIIKRTHESRKPWRQFTKRTAKIHSVEPTHNDHIQSQDQPNQKRGRGKSLRLSEQADEIVTEEDLAAQDAQFRTWLEERIEEQETVGDLQATTSKTRRTLRRSVYGSISSTKNFFRNHQKLSLDRLNTLTGLTGSTKQQEYSFQKKEYLHELLNTPSIVSPLSPGTQTYQTFDLGSDNEPAAAVELSAGPVPAELEGNIPNDPTPTTNVMSRASTPSIRDLPPYVNEKDFRDDIAKDHDTHVNDDTTDNVGPSNDTQEKSYKCTSCNDIVSGHQVYDFCAICDSTDRVLCTKCAARGPCCQHELEGLLRTCALNKTRSTQSEHSDVHGIKRDYSLKHPRLSQSQDDSQIASYTLPIRSLSSPDRSSKQHNNASIHTPATDLKDVQIELLKEMGYIRREQELNNRERELAIRSRELELKDQHTTLREREAIVQQKSDMLMRNLESLVSYQELTKNAFIGAQFQPQKVADTKGSFLKDLGISKDTSSYPISLDNCSHLQNYRVNVAKVVAEADASLHGSLSHGSYMKSYAAQKRKKEAANESTSSTPASFPSPQQSRKPLSRGTSERDGSQDEEEEEDNRRSPKKHKHEPLTPNGPQQLFACPYAKNNPVRFSSRNTAEKNYRGCGTHYLPDVSRLKQHLRRVHWQPDTYCPRCYEEFNTSTKLTEHAKAAVACKARECPFPEKMDKTQQERIHVKRPRVHPERVWYDIYKVLFPGEPLPDSPYMEADDRIITPLSATPQSDVNSQATQMLSNNFRARLNLLEDLQQGPLRDFIEQAFDDSFKELLGAYTLSPTTSPGGAGPSIVVSPVSRSSSDTTRKFGSPVVSSSKRPKLERKRSVTNVVSQPRQVPLLQHPRPPRPKVDTALRVPTDHHRSPLSLSRRESQGSEHLMEGLLSFNVLSHIQDDPGYGDECQSYEQGDDLQAMAFLGEPAPISGRKINNSVISNDSGYGSMKHRQHLPFGADNSTVLPQDAWNGMDTQQFGQETNPGKMSRLQARTHSDQPPTDFTGGLSNHLSGDQTQHGDNGFESYSNMLGPSFHEDVYNGTDYPFFDHQHNPWHPS